MKLYIPKLIVLITIVFIIFLFSLSTFLNVSYDWLFVNSVDFNRIKTWYPKYYKIGFFILKIAPILGLSITIILNSVLFFKQKLYSTYNEVLHLAYFKKYKKLIFIALFFFHILYINQSISNTNQVHVYALLFFSCVFYLLYFLKLFSIKNIQLLFLVSLGLTLRIIYYKLTGPFDIQNDSLARMAQVYTWDVYGGMPGGYSWLPLHHILVYYIGKGFSIPFEISGRLLSLFSSIFLIPIIFTLTKELFNKQTAFLATLFYCLNPFFIKHATIQMANMPFLMFLLSGLYFAILFFKRKSNQKYFWFSILCLNLASLIRFESWVIIPLFSMYFFLKYYKIKKVLLWSSVALASAVVFSILTYLAQGDPIYGVTFSDLEVRESLKNAKPLDFISTLVSWPWIPILFIPFIILGLFSAIKENANRYLASILIILSSYYLFKMADQTLMPFWRYFSFLIILTIPFMFYYLLKRNRFKYLILVFFVFYTTRTAYSISAVYQSYEPLANGFFESAKYFRTNHLKNKSAKLIMSIEPYSTDDFWDVYSGINKTKESFRLLFPGGKYFTEQKPFTINNISDKIVNEHFNFIIIQKGYEIDSVFQKSKVINYLNDKKIDTLIFEEFTLLEID